MSPRARQVPQPHSRHIAITTRDRQIFALLARYRYLPSNFIHAFVGGSEGYHKARMTDLFHEGWLGKPAPQWDAVNARYQFNVYELGRKARTYLEDDGAPWTRPIGTGGAYRHELMVCLIMASFELSAKRCGVGLWDWREVLLRAPETTRAATAPFAIPTGVEQVGMRQTSMLRPDGLPFGLQAARCFWFVGIEADRHTEPLHPVDLRSPRSSILRKLLQYRFLVKERVFEAHFGMPNVMVPIITVNRTHMHNMMELALSISGGQGFKWMLFKTLPEFAGLSGSVRPFDTLLMEDWQRAGNPPLNLLTELTRVVS